MIEVANHVRILRDVGEGCILVTHDRKDGCIYYDGKLFARNCVTDADGGIDGLLLELKPYSEGGQHVMLPWVSARARRIAYTAVRELGLSKDTYKSLRRHIRVTPHIGMNTGRWMPASPVVWIRWVEVDEPVAPWFNGHRLVWESLAVFSAKLRVLTLESFRKRMAYEQGPGLCYPFLNRDARNWWGAAVQDMGWPSKDVGKALGLISQTGYLNKVTD